jgi:hypothetical protein
MARQPVVLNLRTEAFLKTLYPFVYILEGVIIHLFDLVFPSPFILQSAALTADMAGFTTIEIIILFTRGEHLVVFVILLAAFGGIVIDPL